MKIIICAPIHDADHSNGILGLIHLARSLKKQGHHVKMCPMASYPQEEYPINVKVLIAESSKVDTHEYLVWQKIKYFIELYEIELLADFNKDYIEDNIVIYPEVIISNPLKATKIVRYFGNKQGVLTGEITPISPNDFILAHSKTLIENPNHILFFAYINPVFNDTGTNIAENRCVDLYYYGKGSIYTKPEPVEGAIEITRQWPSKKKDLALLLRNTRFFYTYDVWSNINLEAVLCGAVPIFLCDKPFTDNEIDSSELGKLPRIKFTDTDISNSFFSDFEFERSELKNRLKTIQERWNTDVKIFTEKLLKHFNL